MAVLLLLALLFSVLQMVTANDPAYEWGEYALKECKKELQTKDASFRRELRGVCDVVQQVLETYIDVRSIVLFFFLEKLEVLMFRCSQSMGTQLSEAMGISFSQELGPRLSQFPFKATAQAGLRKTIQFCFDNKTRDAGRIQQSIGEWGSGWILKASTNDKGGAGFGGQGLPPQFGGGMKGGGKNEFPPDFDMNLLKEAQEKARKEEMEKKAKELLQKQQKETKENKEEL